MAEDVRKHIVDTAIRLLEAEGPKGFGQTRVAREAKVQQGHLTYYFPRKADLVAAVHERFTEAGREEFARFMARATNLTPAEVRKEFFTHARAMVRDRRRTRVLLALLAESLDDPEVARVLEERGAGQRAMAAMLIGRPHDDLDVDLVMAALQGVGLQHLVRRVDARKADALVGRLQDWVEALPPPRAE